MTRIPPLEPPYTPEVSEDLRKLMPPGMPPIALFRTLAHNPRVLGRVRRGGLLDPGSVSLRDRELVILRTTALCRAEYEWGVHVAFFSAAARLTPAQVAATVTDDLAAFPPAEQVLLQAVDALHQGAAIPDDLWKELASDRTPAQLVELVTLAGQYHTISYLTNALAVALEPGAPRFPA
jgi:alkylhydroperoxidase family enzyme